MMPGQSHSSGKRNFALLAAAATIALVLTSCAQESPTPPGDDAEPVTLRLAVRSGAVESPYAVMANRYAESTPNVTFEIEEVPNEQYAEVIRTQLQGGNAPDVFYVTGGSGDTSSAIPLAEGGYIVPLTGTASDDLLTGDGRSLAEHDGDVWGHPLDFVPTTNNYNLTVAEELGLTLPFTSVDDVFAGCEVASAAGKSLLRLAGSAVPNNGMTTLQLAASRVYVDTPDWNDKRAAGEVTFADTPGWRESIELIKRMYDADCFQTGAEAGVVNENVPAVASGEAVGAFAPGGQTGDLKRLNPDDTYVATVFPGDSPAKTKLFASPTNLLAINAASDEAKQEAAKGFFAWLAEPANADATAELSGNLSIRAGGGASLPTQYSMVESYFAEGNYQNLANQSWPSAEVYVALGTGVQGVLTGQTTVDNVLASMDAAWDAAG